MVNGCLSSTHIQPWKSVKTIQGKCWWTSKGIRHLKGRGLGLASITTYQNNKAIKEVGLSKAMSIPHCETNHCHGFPIQASKFYDNPSYVSCFLIGPLPHVYHSKKNHDPPKPIEVDGE